MKRMMALVAVCAASTLFGGTREVPSTDYPNIPAAIAAAASGDEIVLAKGVYAVSATVNVPAGVTLRGATGDFDDVVIDGGGTVATGVDLKLGATVRDLTVAHFKQTGVTASDYKTDHNVIHCRVTGVGNASATRGGAVCFTAAGGTIADCVVDGNTGSPTVQGSVFNVSVDSTVDGCVITNNVMATTAGADAAVSMVYVSGGGVTLRNSFIGYNNIGAVRPTMDMETSSVSWGVVRLAGGTIDNCVIGGNRFRGKVPNGLGAVMRTGGTVKNSIIVGNGLGTDDWVAAAPGNFRNCLTTGADAMTSSVEASAGDVFFEAGGLPWLPYGSAAIGAGTDGGDIGRIHTPGSLVCGIVADRRTYLGTATAHLLAVASEEATFAWEIANGAASIVADGATADVTFAAPGEVRVRVTANGTATGEITLVSGEPVREVSTAAELVAAVDEALDGAEIVLAPGDYAPARELVLTRAVTVRGATGNRYDVRVSGSNARRVFTVDHPDAVIASLTVKNGKSSTTAGGVFLETGGTLTNVCVTGCSATGTKGWYEDATWYCIAGSVVANYEGTVVDCDFASNKKTFNANALAVYGQHGQDAFADRLFVTNNTSTSSAGSYYSYRSAPVGITGGGTVRNSFIAFNDINQPNGGSTYQDATGVLVHKGRLENSTIFRNRVHASYLGRAPGVYLTANGTAVNCLVTENGDAGGNLNNCAAANLARFEHCAMAPVPDGTTLCVDYSDAPATLYDLNAVGYPVPKAQTPTVDAGDDTLEWIAHATDLFGADRRQGEAVDIGAYEAKPAADALSCELVVTCDAAAAEPYDVSLAAVVSGTRKTGLSYMWRAIRTYLGVVMTNTVVTADPAYVFTDLGKGDWAFALTVTNDHEPPDVSTDETDGNVLHLSPAVCYVSPTGAHEWPYDTPATASTNFTDVAAEARGRIVILPGAYENLPHVTDAEGRDFVGIFDRAVSVEGPDDPRSATINCAGRGGFRIGNGNAVLRGVAFTNFSTTAEGQSALTVAAGVASNIVVDACNRAATQQANFVNVGPGAVLSDSLLTGARSADMKGGYVLSCRGGLIRNVSISSNRNEYTYLVTLTADAASQRAGRMESCVIEGNSTFGTSVACSGAVVLEDCRIEGNQTSMDLSYPILTMGKGTAFRRCRILRNASGGTAIVSGGTSNLDNPSLIENCLIAENEVRRRSGSAIALSANSGASLVLVNTTVANNKVLGGGGVDCGNGTSTQYPALCSVTNTIVSGNISGSGETAVEMDVIGTAFFPERAKIGHCCYLEAGEGDGNFNIAKDPRLKGRGKEPYALKSGSPCVGTGDASVWTADDIDLVGNPRLHVKGGVSVDMGCYENVIKGFLLKLK